MFIPIDDADLNPQALPGILRQLQLLQHPNVCILFCVQQKSLNSLMYIQALEQHTNADNARPVVNFNTLIDRKIRDTEDVRASAQAKIQKFLPYKYRVEIKGLTPTERLNFRPLIRDEDKDAHSFLELLRKIPMDVFDNRRTKTLAEFFDWSTAVERCSYEYKKGSDYQGSAKGYCQICVEGKCLTRKLAEALPASLKGEQDKSAKKRKEWFKNRKKCFEKNGLTYPIPSHYAEALPEYPRQMDNIYKIILGWVDEIVHINPVSKTEDGKNETQCEKLKNEVTKLREDIGKLKEDDKFKNGQNDETIKHKEDLLQLKEKKLQEEQEKEEHDAPKKRKIVADAVKELIETCLYTIPLLPKYFIRKIKFIDNPDVNSLHPILVEFKTHNLTNQITTGNPLEIRADHSGKSSRILSIHSISQFQMYTAAGYNKEKGESANSVPMRDWERCHPQNGSNVYEKDQKGKDRYYFVPQRYFALYNLTYDLTTRRGVFGRVSNHNDYEMRDDTPLGIFSVNTRTSTVFRDCYCAMPRWYQLQGYDIFAMIWNDLVKNVRGIMKSLKGTPQNSFLADWVMLSLLRIHICIEMNWSPFLVTKDEIEKLKTAMHTKAEVDKLKVYVSKLETEIKGINGDEAKNQEKQEELNTKNGELAMKEKELADFITPIKQFVKQGLFSVMEHIKTESQQHILSHHHQAFKAWIEYGLPMLSNSDYVSHELGQWIAYQWIMLLVTNDDEKVGNDNILSCKIFSDRNCKDGCKYTLQTKYNLGSEGNPQKEDCASCAYPRLSVIVHMLQHTKQSINSEIHRSHYFLQEYVKQEQNGHTSITSTTKPLNESLFYFTFKEVSSCKKLMPKLKENWYGDKDTAESIADAIKKAKEELEKAKADT